ncbi:MAG: PQQ-binding-like beta-propeller repeat protein [Desulfurococcales archaeon]|nr:PQQ-binding-like beta-propeller repeat protein [Desulfurococcales archaeon]
MTRRRSVFRVGKLITVTLVLALVLVGILVAVHSLFTWISWRSTIEHEVDHVGGWIRVVRWNPTGDKIAVGIGGFNLTDKRGGVLVYNSSGGVLWHYNTSSPVVNIEWISEGKDIFVATKTGNIYLFDSNTGRILWNTSLHGYLFDASLSPNGRLIAIAVGVPSPGVYVFYINGSMKWMNPSFMEAYDVEWSKNGELLAACYTINIPTTSGELAIYSSNGKKVYSYNSSTEFWRASFSPSMNYLVIVHGFPYHSVVSYELNGSSLGKQVSKAYLGGAVWNIFWRDNKLMLAVGYPSNHFFITYPDNLKKGVNLFVLKGQLTASDPSPKGDLVALSSEWFKHYTESHGSLYIYNFKGRLLWSTDNLNGGGYSLAWSPDGRKLAAGTKLGTLYILDSNNFRYGTYFDGLSLLSGLLIFMGIIILINRKSPRIIRFY